MGPVHASVANAVLWFSARAIFIFPALVFRPPTHPPPQPNGGAKRLAISASAAVSRSLPFVFRFPALGFPAFARPQFKKGRRGGAHYVGIFGTSLSAHHLRLLGVGYQRGVFAHAPYSRGEIVTALKRKKPINPFGASRSSHVAIPT